MLRVETNQRGQHGQKWQYTWELGPLDLHSMAVSNLFQFEIKSAQQFLDPLLIRSLIFLTLCITPSHVPSHPHTLTLSQNDLDQDGLGDVCDNGVDKDKDGVQDSMDNCLGKANADQVDSDGDDVGDECDTDSDNDGILNEDDNCKLIANADQTDSDGMLGDQVGGRVKLDLSWHSNCSSSNSQSN